MEDKWVEKSEDDLRKAKDNFKISNYDLSSFLCQQSVEKALKALLIKKTKEFPKIHDLVRLGRLVGLNKKFLTNCKRLTSVYIETRYPGISDDEYSKDESLEDIQMTEEILKWVKKKL